MNPLLQPIVSKLERYCAYQERCHQEVVQKLRNLKVYGEEADAVIVHLLAQDFLNEERFARSFARGRYRIKGWGIARITSELKARGISSYNIKLALAEINPDDYEHTFELLAERKWASISDRDVLKKRRKFCDAMLRRGYAPDLVYAKVKALESSR